MKSIIASALVVLLLSPALVGAEMTGEEVYQKACGVCHDNGVAGAPKLGDKTAWTPRIAEGMDVLYHTALQGEGAMPAKGGNASLSDAETKAAVDYMVENSK